MHRVTQNSVGEGDILVIPMSSGFRPSEKELPQQHSDVFWHKNTTGLTDTRSQN
jgi:hypothetical protein